MIKRLAIAFDLPSGLKKIVVCVYIVSIQKSVRSAATSRMKAAGLELIASADKGAGDV
jgi:hypothetical protein